MQFDSINHLSDVFTSLQLKTLPSSIIIEETVYTGPYYNPLISTDNICNQMEMCFVGYLSEDGNYLSFMWSNNNNCILPSRVIDGIIQPMNETTQLSFEEQIVINGINNNQPIPCKIDTGADMCCIDGRNINITNNTVSFEFNNKQYSLGIVGKMDVQQADSDGNTSRPIVQFHVSLNGIQLNNVQFNINDRSNMESKILIGQNLLTQGDFIIKPPQQDNITNEMWNTMNATLLAESSHNTNNTNITNIKFKTLLTQALKLL